MTAFCHFLVTLGLSTLASIGGEIIASAADWPPAARIGAVLAGFIIGVHHCATRGKLDAAA